MAKRSVLEIESSLAQTLLQAADETDFITAFESLKWMSISSIDFQIRILPQRALTSFLKMLLVVLRSHRDFELVQSYLAAFLRIHRNKLWTSDAEAEDLEKTLDELRNELRSSWERMDQLLLDNASMIQWIKTALL
ncbi:unnamed protein product [Gongylonema pulchrum]|uniref:Utp21 domain-containing protein n=1 Tax=Gongylonema pulchrum TaxID=637853 RepID=A0A183EPT4_9BILA|nr:unnamed protein product [Gongylonema pulchrum]